jgi:hypothetical protein
MGSYSDSMGFYSDSKGFYNDSMGYQWDIPSGNLLATENGPVEIVFIFTH